MKRINKSKIVDHVMALMVFLWMLTGACGIGLTLVILKAVLTAFGIQVNI
jgi:hypothetical protein